MRYKESKSKSVLIFTALTAFFISGLTSSTAPAATANSLPSTADFSSLQSCMNNSEASLNIVYIMDNSKSMGPKGENSDPENARGPMLQSTLRILQQVGADSNNRPVNYVMVPFGDPKTKINAEEQEWRSLTPENLPDEVSRLDTQAQEENASGTDWKSGLSVAKEKIVEQKTKDDNSCFVAIWLTDGQIDMNFNKPGFTYATGKAFRDICESDDLINWYRNPDNKVSLLGALLSRNENFLADGTRDASKLSMHEKSVLLFEAVVTGRSNSSIPLPKDVIDEFGLGSNTDENGIYTCGNVRKNSNLGLLVKNGDAVDLSWQFVELVAGIAGMRKVVLANDSIYAPDEIGKIQIYVKGPESRVLKLIDKAGNNVCDLSGVECTPSGAMQNGTYTMFTVDLPKTGVAPGDLVISMEPKPEEYKVYVGLKGKYKELKLVSDHDPSFSEFGEGSAISREFRVVDRDGNNFPFSGNVEICRTSPVPVDPDCKPTSPAGFDFSVSITDESIAAAAVIQISGIENPFQLDLSHPIKVFDEGKFAKFNCTAVNPCALQPIPNKLGKSKTPITIYGAEKGSSTIKIIGFDADDIPERSASYDVSFDPKEVGPSEIQVAEGDEVELDVYLWNTQAKGKANDITGSIVYLVANETVNDGKPQRAEAPVTFSINQEKSWSVIIIGYLLALLLAVGLPYLALLLQARRSAVFIDDEFKYIAVPVMVSKSGELLSKKDSALEESFQNEVPDSANSNAGFEPFVAPSFKGLSGIIQIPKGAKSIQIDKATLKVEAARFDAFAPIKVSLSVPDSIVYSFVGKSANQLLKNESTADQSLSGLVFLYSNISTIEPTDRKSFVESQSSDDSFDSDGETMSFETNRAVSEEAFEGTLVIAIPGMKNEPVVLGKIATSLRSQSFEKFNAELLALREQELAVEQESAAKQKAAAESNSGFAAGPVPNSSNSNKSQNDDFDDSDTIHFSSNTNQSSSDDDDF